MKNLSIKLFLVLISISTHLLAQNTNPIFDKTDKFLSQYVTAGLVDYSLVKSNSKELTDLISEIESTNITEIEAQKALLINLYNLSTIKLIIDKYPIGSPQEITGFYDQKVIQYNNKKISLNELENEVLRKKYKDARLHFVLVCGALGCPPITNFAYTPQLLESQLNTQTTLAFDNIDFIEINNTNKKVRISEIFNWYEADFVSSQYSVIQFINKYKTLQIPSDYKTEFITYNWKLNDLKSMQSNNAVTPFDPSDALVKRTSTQDFTPSVLYTKGQWEYKFFNNLYTQTAGFDENGSKQKYNNRGSYFSSINQVLIGVNSRFNIGLDFWVKSVRIDDVSSSPFKLLQFETSNNTRTALTNIGPKVKFQPFKKLSHLSVQSTFLIPIASDQEGKFNGKPYLSSDSYISITQVFYDQALGKKFQVFFQVAPWVYIKRKSSVNESRFGLSSPVDVFLSFFATDRFTVYLQQEYWPNFGAKGVDSWFRQEGVGAKYQIIKGKLETEMSMTNFSMGKGAGAGVTYNFGVRIIHL